jgi:hypothetical protein
MSWGVKYSLLLYTESKNPYTLVAREVWAKLHPANISVY